MIATVYHLPDSILQLKKVDHAIVQLLKARELHPKLRGVAHPLAVLHGCQERFELTKQKNERALQKDENNADILNDLGYLRYSQEGLQDAQTMLTKARKLKPTHTQSTVNRPMVRLAQGDFDGVFELFRSLVGPLAVDREVGLPILLAEHDEDSGAHLQKVVQQAPSLLAAQYRDGN